MSSKLPLIFLLVLVVVGGSLLLRSNKKKEDPRIAVAEEELANTKASQLTQHTFEILPQACTVAFTSAEEPYTKWTVNLRHPEFSFVVGGDAMTFMGTDEVWNEQFAITRPWLPSDGGEKKSLDFPVTEIKVPYTASPKAMEWVGRFSQLFDICQQDAGTVSK